MTGRRRYHPFFALRFMRRTLLLYLVPLVQVLFRRDWAALSTALAQDLVLFCLLAAVSWVMLHASSWELDAEGVLRLRWDLLVSFERTIQGSQLAAVQVERPVAYRLAGACRGTLYPALLPRRQAVTLCLQRRGAGLPARRPPPPPPGRTRRSWRTRSSLAWSPMSISEISSRKRVPPAAASKRPILPPRLAPVKAPSA